MRANLVQSGLSMHLWCYALDAAVYVYNRRLHTGIKKVPIHAFLKQRVDLDHLVVFGCIGVCHIDEDKRSSRHDLHRAKLVRMLGYDENGRTGTYLVCDFTGKIFRAKVDKWYEDIHCFSELLEQLPRKTPRVKDSTDVDDPDEQLRRDEAKLNKELNEAQTQEKRTQRTSSRAKRQKSNRLRFIPGVNYGS